MIKFPRVHIAESVVNRILDTFEALEQRGAPPEVPAMPAPPPSVPDPTGAGLELDAALRAPQGDMPPLEGEEPAPDELAAAVASGTDLISA